MNEKILKELTEYLKGIRHIDSGEIPSLDLYMDQVTGFMEQHLASVKRYPEDKVLTKTMINNYAKNRLLPPPVKKRYSRDHMLVLLFIYYYKGILSLSDIETILRPISDKYFSGHGALSLRDIYEEVFSLGDDEMSSLLADLERKFESASGTFSEESLALSQEDREQLRLFSFLGILGFDVYLKKQLMEKIIDGLRVSAASSGNGPKKHEKS